MEETVLERFKKAVTFLLESKIANKQKEIAVSCEVSSNYLSGVLHERISLSPSFIEKFLSKWPINPDYLTFQSEMIHIIKEVKSKKGRVLSGDDSKMNISIIKLINRLKSDKISKSQRLEAGDELSELFATLIDENIDLRRYVMENYDSAKKN